MGFNSTKTKIYGRTFFSYLIFRFVNGLAVSLLMTVAYVYRRSGYGCTTMAYCILPEVLTR